MRWTKTVFLLIICGAALHGMEEEGDPPPQRSRLSVWDIPAIMQNLSDTFLDFVEDFPGAAGAAAKKVFDQIPDMADKTLKKAIEQIKPGGEFYNNVNALLVKNLGTWGAITVLTAAGSAFATYGVRTGWRIAERNLMRPKLVIASSKKTLLQHIKDRLLFRHKNPDAVPEMIFHEELETRLRDIVRATQTIHAKTKAGATNVKYRNLMLWGPPGTGKTMFAKRLAIESGLEWAIMSGSSFAKFSDGEGIEALDDLFKWANKSRGLLIFIDEAEAFLARREQMDLNSKAYQLLTNFLNHTGERSNKFMMVFATNHKQVIDSAIHRRIDDLVELPLPGALERFQVLQLYRNKILFDIKQNGKIFVDSVRLCVDDTKLIEIAERTDGFSNGDLEGIINIIKTDADITEYGLVTLEVVDMAVQHALEKYAAFRTRYQLRKTALYDQLWRVCE